MSLFDRLRPRWKHSDPLVREQAVLELDDQEVLQEIAFDDPDETVRLAAVRRLTLPRALARLARRKDEVAIAAMQRLSDPADIAELALTSESRAVRGLAVDKIDDGMLLHRVASSDTDAWVRAKARNKRLGPDEKRDHLRSELSKLRLAQRKAQDVAGLCGSLEDICSTLAGGGPFHINGTIDPHPGAAASTTTVSDTSVTGLEYAHFLASRPAPGEAGAAASVNVFYEVKVWRVGDNQFEYHAEERRLQVVRDAMRWSRVSNGAATAAAEREHTAAH